MTLTNLSDENYDGTSTQPSATGTNSIAIGVGATAPAANTTVFNNFVGIGTQYTIPQGPSYALDIKGDSGTTSGSNTIKLSYGDNVNNWLLISDGSTSSNVMARNKALNIATRHNDNINFTRNNTNVGAFTSSGLNVVGSVTVGGTVDGVDIAQNIPATLGTAGQVLTVNSGGTAGEWADAGGGADLFADNYDGTATKPSTTGTNGVAIGRSANATGSDSIGLGLAATATNTSSVALGLSRSGGTHSTSFNTVTSSASYGALGNNSLAGIYIAKASGQRSVSIGNESQSTNTDSIAMGNSTLASGSGALALGNDAHATNTNSSSIGSSSRATGNTSLAMNSGNAAGERSTAIGLQSLANEYGKFAFASGYFAANGDAQGGQFILRADTTDATATVLTTNNSTAGSTNQIVAASDTCITFSGTVVAMQNGAQSYGSWEVRGLLVNDGGTTTLPVFNISEIGSSGWKLNLYADNTNNALTVQVTGVAATNIRWVANIATSEVTYA